VNKGLLGEVFRMAIDTLRTNKMRSGLTVLGVVIGITSIVGMTSLVRGFDESLRDSIRELGPNTIILSKLSIISISGGADFDDLMRRPNLTIGDARAIEKLAPSVEKVDVMLGNGPGGVQERIFYEGQRTRPQAIIGATEQFAEVGFRQMALGRFFTEPEVLRRKRVVVLGNSSYQALFAPSGLDPINKKVRVGAIEYTVVGVFVPSASLSGFDTGQDDFVVIPQTTHQVVFGTDATRPLRTGQSFGAQLAIVAREGLRDEAMNEIEQVMRIRHGLKLDEPNDFDVVTQEAAMRIYDQFTQAVFLALVVISSIALMVGGIGVMAIMMISVTERTREIGVRKALGARRQAVLVQFLAEAAVLTSVGGILGIICGTAIGVGINLATGFPISLPWWSFAMGLGFSAAVGIFFGMFPAVRAANLDPIEALRYE
jgi:putative ABC transport system permease protein